MNKSILVPLDGSQRGLAALPVARALARAEGAELQVVFLTEQPAAPSELAQRLGLEPEDFRGTVIDQRAGDPSEQLLRAAAHQRGATLVMCPHTGAPTVRGELGPIGERLLQEATGPLVLVRPELNTERWQLRNVLLPHDGTPTTTWATRDVAQLASAAGAMLTVLHVAVPGATPPLEPGSLHTPQYLDQPQHEWPAWASEFLERLESVVPIDPRKLRLVVARGDPGEEIVRHARAHEADLIVLAWRGTLAAERAAVIKAVLREAPCPIMLLRTS